MTTTLLKSRLSTRLDPSQFSADDTESVRHLVALFRNETKPPALVDEGGHRLELPRPIYDMLVRVASAMQEGKVIALVPEMQELTTQAAANILGRAGEWMESMLQAVAVGK